MKEIETKFMAGNQLIRVLRSGIRTPLLQFQFHRMELRTNWGKFHLHFYGIGGIETFGCHLSQLVLHEFPKKFSLFFHRKIQSDDGEFHNHRGI
jgi:superfamily I DNA and RNA helicase